MVLDFEQLGPKLSMQDVLQRVSEEAIYKHWCKEFPKALMSSPLREDRKPSFGFYRSSSGKWRWKDMARGVEGDVFDFVAAKEKTDVRGAIEIIGQVFFISAKGTYQPRIVDHSIPYHQRVKQRTLIQAVRRPIEHSDLEYWNRILINPSILDMYMVRAAEEVWYQRPGEEKKLWAVNKWNNPIYYWLSPYSPHIKCYRPFEKPERKWLSNMSDLTDVQGYSQCQVKCITGRPLILTQSMKASMFFRAFGINAMAANAEGNILSDDFIRHLRKYCGPIVTLYDPDPAGIKGAKRLEKSNGIPPIFICSKWGAKDPPDLWLANYRKVYDLLNLIHEYFSLLRNTARPAYAPRELRDP